MSSKNNNMKNKLFSIVTSIALFTAPMNLQAWNPTDNLLGNITGIGTYSDDYTKSKYMYGGSIVYKFNNNYKGNNSPLFDFQTPGIKAGCNGVSITGGFLQVLGIDGLTEQLRNGSTAVLYGVVIGLIYSTPAINQALDQIRQVANWLQKFNQDACNIGRTIGESMAKRSGAEEMNEKVNGFFAGMIAEGSSMVNDLLGDVNKHTPDTVKAEIKKIFETNNEDTKQETAEVNTKAFNHYFEKVGLAGLILKDNLIPYSGGSKNIQEVTLENNNDSEKLYSVLFYLFGDASFDAETISYIQNESTCMTELISLGRLNNAACKEKHAAKIAVAISDPSKKIPAPPKHTITMNSTLGVEEKINILLYGNKSGTQSASTQLEVPKISVLAGRLRTYGGTNYKELLTFSKTNGTDTIPWEGVMKMSSDFVDCALNYKRGTTTTCNDFPMAFGKFSYYLNILKDFEAKLENQYGATYAKSASIQYRQILAKYNALMIGDLLVGSIAESASAYKAGNQIPESQSMEDMIKNIRDAREGIRREIEKQIVVDNDVYKNIDDMFKMLNLEIIKEKLQN